MSTRPIKAFAPPFATIPVLGGNLHEGDRVITMDTKEGYRLTGGHPGLPRSGSPWIVAAGLRGPHDLPSGAIWKIDTSLFIHPVIGNHLPQIIENPDQIDSKKEIDPVRKGMVDQLSQTFKKESSQLWEFNGKTLSREEEDQIYQAVHDRLSAIARMGEYDFFATTIKSWEFIAYSHVETAFPTFSTPLESVLNHLHGAMYLYSRWGSVAFMNRFSVSAFWSFAEDAEIPQESYLQKVDDDYHFEIRPGSYEAFGGINYSLVFDGRTKSMGGVYLPIASLGVVRRPQGYAIVSLQGGQRLRRTKIIRNGRTKDLLQETRKVFGGDPREWLARKVIANLRQEDPTGQFFMRRGERVRWLFVEHKKKVETLPLADLRNELEESIQKSVESIKNLEKEAARRTLSPEEASLLGSHQSNVADIRNALLKAARLNELAQRLGFEPEEDPESSWLVYRQKKS